MNIKNLFLAFAIIVATLPLPSMAIPAEENLNYLPAFTDQQISCAQFLDGVWFDAQDTLKDRDNGSCVIESARSHNYSEFGMGGIAHTTDGDKRFGVNIDTKLTIYAYGSHLPSAAIESLDKEGPYSTPRGLEVGNHRTETINSGCGITDTDSLDPIQIGYGNGKLFSAVRHYSAREECVSYSNRCEKYRNTVTYDSSAKFGLYLRTGSCTVRFDARAKTGADWGYDYCSMFPEDLGSIIPNLGEETRKIFLLKADSIVSQLEASGKCILVTKETKGFTPAPFPEADGGSMSEDAWKKYLELVLDVNRPRQVEEKYHHAEDALNMELGVSPDTKQTSGPYQDDYFAPDPNYDGSDHEVIFDTPSPDGDMPMIARHGGNRPLDPYRQIGRLGDFDGRVIIEFPMPNGTTERVQVRRVGTSIRPSVISNDVKVYLGDGASIEYVTPGSGIYRYEANAGAGVQKTILEPPEKKPSYILPAPVQDLIHRVVDYFHNSDADFDVPHGIIGVKG